ncbi:hypothetical protein IL54_0021 [Sphingobium sp. ba1]|nr:hypothetical protein IL54_0021 [Sphingobium sp. ba1]
MLFAFLFQKFLQVKGYTRFDATMAKGDR